MDGERKSCVIVISPLISLTVDQVRNLRVSGVEAVVISSVSRQSMDEQFLTNEETLEVAASFALLKKLCRIQSGSKYLKNPL